MVVHENSLFRLPSPRFLSDLRQGVIQDPAPVRKPPGLRHTVLCRSGLRKGCSAPRCRSEPRLVGEHTQCCPK